MSLLDALLGSPFNSPAYSLQEALLRQQRYANASMYAQMGAMQQEAILRQQRAAKADYETIIGTEQNFDYIDAEFEVIEEKETPLLGNDKNV